MSLLRQRSQAWVGVSTAAACREPLHVARPWSGLGAQSADAGLEGD